MLNELKMAARSLAKRPGYAAIAAFTLALGIAANVAIFTVVDAVLLNPLPYADAARIVTVRHHAPGLDLPDLGVSPGLVALYREEARTLARLAAYQTGELNLTAGGRPDRVEVVQVTPEMFDVLAVRPSRGRPFLEADATKDAPPQVAILTHALWQSRFGGDPDVVGRLIELDGLRTEVVGIMPDGFAFPDANVRILVPFWVDPAGAVGSFGAFGVARLAPGVTLEAARREIAGLQRRIPERFPDVERDFLDRAGWSTTVRPLKDDLVADISTTLWILFGTVGLVLLIAGANVANLFLVRAESRHREMAVRSALGAGRWPLARAFLAESLVLALAGCVAGSLMAWAAVRLLVAYSPADLPRIHEVRIDGSVLAFAVALSLCAGIVLGALPMLHLAGQSFVALLRDAGRRTTAARSRHRMRQLLIGGQVAVALVLLVASTLMLRSAARLYAVDPGIAVEGVVTAGVSLGSRPERPRGIVFYQQVLDQVSALPGIVSGGAASSLPIGVTAISGGDFEIESRPRPEQDLPPVAMYMAVTPGYFETLRVPLLAGRAPEWVDATRERQVAWVNQTFARTFLDDKAVGERIKLADIWLDIVGVVGDVRTFGLQEEIRPLVYMTIGSAAVGLDVMHVVVRTSPPSRTRAGEAGAAPETIAPLLRQAVDRVDASVPLTTVRTMEDVVAASLAETWFTMVLLACAAGGALVLGVVGLYGVIRYIVAQRTAEIGVRIALGARPRDVQAMVLRQGLTVTLAGVGAGLVIAWASSRVMASLLFEVSAHDPATFALVALVLTAVSALATYLPARTAAGIDPSRALRQDA